MNITIWKTALRGATSLSAFVMLSGTAQAQDTAAAAENANTDDGGIIVTGSRIPRPELELPNPIMVVTAQDLTDAGTTNLTDALKTIPALVGSIDSYRTSGERAGVGTTGLTLLNLRNLGAARTLVLVDGRRHVGAFAGIQAVDINTIPSDLVERVEVLTGGVSAIYGADGVSGVVNFIQKKDFEGVTGRVQNGISKYGDAGQRLVALTAGHTFAEGRGNFALAWEHSEEDRLKASQRSYLSGENRVGFYLNPEADDGDPNTPYYQYVPLKNVRYNDSTRDGAIDVNLNRFPDLYGATGQPYDRGTTIPYGTRVPNSYQQGGSGTLVSDYAGDLLPQINRDILSASFHYDFSDAFTLYAEGKYANTRSYSEGQPTYDYYLKIKADNPYLPAAAQAYANQTGFVLVNRDNFDFGRRGEDITRETLRGVLGGKGEISPNLSYDLSYVYGQTKITSHYINNMLTDRYYAAIDAVSDGKGGVTCRVNMTGTTTSQPYNYTRSNVPRTTFSPGECLPLNLFGENNASNQAALDWIMADTTDRTTITQHVVSGAITGDTGGTFELPGGPVRFAAGGEYRKEKSVFRPDELVAQGLTFSNVLNNERGSFDVWDAFGEVDLPILADTPFAKRLGVNGALRYSDYSSVGSTNSWKIGAEWAPVQDITFRATYSKAVRAPNINELYGSTTQTYQTIKDPCSASSLQNGTQYRAANCQALLSSLGVANPASYTGSSSSIAGYSTGNPDLQEETAWTWTAGIVLQPSFAPGLAITADWYDIRIENAINTASAEELAKLCVDQASLDNQYCDLVVRQNGGSHAGYITSYTLTPFNVAEIRTSGLDLQISYVHPTENAGTFGVRLRGNYLHRLTSIPVPGADPVNEAYVADNRTPKFQITTDLTWAKGPFSLDWQVNYMSAMYRADRQTVANNPNVYAPEYMKIKALFSHDVSASLDVGEQFTIYGGVRNLFNQKPDIGEDSQPISAVGRYFFLGATVKMADLFGGAK